MTPRAEAARRPRTSPRPEDWTLIWTPTELARWGVVVILAAIGTFVTWYLVGGEATFDHQVPALDFAVISVVVAGAANVSLLMAGRRAIGARRRALLGEPAALDPRDHEATNAYSVAAPAATAGASSALSTVEGGHVALIDLVAQPGLKHYHLSDCPMAAGRNWPVASLQEHIAAGRTPCGVCRP